jgi:phage terminase small subunit
MSAKRKKKAAKPADELAPQLKRFADEYLVDCNGTRAWKASHPETESDAAAATSASLALRNPKVAAYVAERQKTLADKVGVTAERVLRELAKVAFADPRLVAEWGPGGVKLIDSSEISDAAAAAIAEVSEKPTMAGPAIGFKLHDKLGALNALGKHLALFVERHAVGGDPKNPTPVQSAVQIYLPNNGRDKPGDSDE